LQKCAASQGDAHAARVHSNDADESNFPQFGINRVGDPGRARLKFPIVKMVDKRNNARGNNLVSNITQFLV
jgi:hypothetical protein